MKNSFIKIFLKNNIRIYVADLKKVINDIYSYHKYLPLPNLILANAITCFTLLQPLYKSEKLMVKISSNGAMKNLIFEAQKNSVRALISNPNIETEYDQEKFNEIPIILGIGDSGILEVSRKIQNEYFNSETPLVKFNIVTDLVYFLNKSDQIYSAIVKDVRLKKNNPNEILEARSILFQLLPEHNEEDKIWIEEFIKNLNFEKTTQDKLEKKLDAQELDIEFFNANCWCNIKKIKETIWLLSDKEKKELFGKNKNIDVTCEFCKKEMIIKEEEII